MQKVALVSYHYFRNYGTCLQAFALQHVITHHFKVDCEYLDFGQSEYPGMFSKQSIWSEIKLFRRKLLALKYTIADEKSTKQFKRFKNEYLKISRRFQLDDLTHVEDQYSAFIVGSDQTWNPMACSKAYYPPMLLSFVKSSKKKFSYAPSMGNIDNVRTVETLLKKSLCDYNMLSTREKASTNYLSKILERDVSLVLDPTMLLTPEEWMKITSNHKVKYLDYVFCYLLGSRDIAFEFAQNLAKQNNKKLIVIALNNKYKERADIYPSGIGPLEFVQLIANADYVVTDSFHGTAFSLNFSKQFYSFYKREGGRDLSDNRRIYDLLDIFGLCHRIVDENSSNNNYYEKAEVSISEERLNSFQYLGNIFKNR